MLLRCLFVNPLAFVVPLLVGLQWLRGTIEVHDEMDEMRAENEAMKVIPAVTLREMLSNPMLQIPLGISVMIMLGQQLSGINAVSDLYELYSHITPTSLSMRDGKDPK